MAIGRSRVVARAWWLGAWWLGAWWRRIVTSIEAIAADRG
jgi:hypothetical protein